MSDITFGNWRDSHVFEHLVEEHKLELHEMLHAALSWFTVNQDMWRSQAVRNPAIQGDE